MSGRSRPGDALLGLSDRTYRALLALYPRAFRLAFAAAMAQAFRDSCRQARAERGAMGVAALWGLVLGDLAVSAVQEHLSKEGHMSRTTIVRAAGIAAVVGGVLYLLSTLTHPSGPLRATVPASVVGMLLGAVGLHARLWGREGRLGRVGFALAGVGLTLGLIGMTGSALGIMGDNPLAVVINTGEHAGLVFIGAGLLMWGIVTLQVNALGRWSALPLIMGLLSLPAVVFVSPELFAALEHSVIPPIFAAGWLLLGLALLTSRPMAAPAPTLVVAK